MHSPLEILDFLTNVNMTHQKFPSNHVATYHGDLLLLLLCDMKGQQPTPKCIKNKRKMNPLQGGGRGGGAEPLGHATPPQTTPQTTQPRINSTLPSMDNPQETKKPKCPNYLHTLPFPIPVPNYLHIFFPSRKIEIKRDARNLFFF